MGKWGLPWWLSGKESRLPVQEPQVWSLTQEDSIGHRAAKPMCHNYQACAPQQENPLQRRRRTTTREQPQLATTREEPT